jgi:hypothetical protein
MATKRNTDRIAELERTLGVTRYTVVHAILGHGIAARPGDVLMHAPSDTVLPLAVLRYDGDEWRTVADSTTRGDITGWLRSGSIERRSRRA